MELLMQTVVRKCVGNCGARTLLVNV